MKGTEAAAASARCAEDATQEVFLRVWERAAELPAGDAAWAWTLRVATNYCLNQLRDGKGRRSVELDPQWSDRSDVEAQVLNRDAVRRALEECPEQLRGPALLCYGEGRVHGVLGADPA